MSGPPRAPTGDGHSRRWKVHPTLPSAVATALVGRSSPGEVTTAPQLAHCNGGAVQGGGVAARSAATAARSGPQ